jgi:hypothetical protein
VKPFVASNIVRAACIARMASPPPAKTDPIAVVGAGIFGLSTAIYLALRGYSNVTVFDRQPYEQTLYNYLDGCDAASAGTSKCLLSRDTSPGAVANKWTVKISIRLFARDMAIEPNTRSFLSKPYENGIPGTPNFGAVARQFHQE